MNVFFPRQRMFSACRCLAVLVWTQWRMFHVWYDIMFDFNAAVLLCTPLQGRHPSFSVTHNELHRCLIEHRRKDARQQVCLPVCVCLLSVWTVNTGINTDPRHSWILSGELQSIVLLQGFCPELMSCTPSYSETDDDTREDLCFCCSICVWWFCYVRKEEWPPPDMREEKKKKRKTAGALTSLSFGHHGSPVIVFVTFVCKREWPFALHLQLETEVLL